MNLTQESKQFIKNDFPILLWKGYTYEAGDFI